RILLPTSAADAAAQRRYRQWLCRGGCGFRGRYGWRWNAHFPRATWGAPQPLEALQIFLVDAPDGADFDAEESPRDEQPPDVGFRRLKRAGGLGNRERTRSVHGLTILARSRNNFFQNCY